MIKYALDPMGYSHFRRDTYAIGVKCSSTKSYTGKLGIQGKGAGGMKSKKQKKKVVG